MDRRGTDSGGRSHSAAGPVRAPVIGLLLYFPEHTRLYCGCQCAGLATDMAAFQSRDAPFFEAGFPAGDGRTRGVQFGLDPAVAEPVSQCQYQPCLEYVASRKAPRVRPPCQFLPLLVGQLDHRLQASHTDPGERQNQMVTLSQEHFTRSRSTHK
jgi:hypothetical protein